MAGREAVGISNPKCSLQGEVLVSLCPVCSLPLSLSPHLLPLLQYLCSLLVYRDHALPASRRAFAGLVPWPHCQKQTFSKPRLMYFSKAFPTHTMLGVTKAV